MAVVARATGDRILRVLRPLSARLLVGREEQRSALVELASTTPSLGVVEGQAGVGKTRLVSAVAEDAARAGRRVLAAGCLPLADPIPLGVVVSVLRTAGLHFSSPPAPIAGALRPLLPEVAALLPPAPPRVEDPAEERHLRFRAMREVLARIGPALCVLDDLQWCDQASSDFLRFLLADMPDSLSLLVTYRPEDLSATSSLLGILSRLPARVATVRVALEPLTLAQVSDLIEAIIGRPAPAPVAGVVHGQSGGLPFAVEELLRLAHDRGLLPEMSPSDIETMDVPSTVRDSILDRVATLGQEARRMAEAAAIVEVPGDAALLGTVADLAVEAARAGLAEALTAAVVVEPAPGLYCLRHALACRSVAEAIPRPQRRWLHLRAADALEQARPRPAARLSHHCREAGELSRSLRHAEAAARGAEARGDPDGAIRLLRDAILGGATTPGAQARVADAVSRVALRSGLATQRAAVEALRGVLESGALRPEVRGRVRRHLGSLRVWAGDAAGGYEALRRCLAELAGEGTATVDVMLDLATCPNLALRFDDRLAWLGRATPLARSLRDPAIDLRLRGARARVLLQSGDPAGWDAVRDLPSRPTSAIEHSVLSWTRLDLALACIYLGYDHRARGLLTQATRLPDPSKHRFNILGEAVALLLRFLAGEWAGIDPTACVRVFAGLEMPSAAVIALQIEGLLALARDDPGRAAAALQECAHRAEAAGLARSVAVATAGLARLHLRQGDPGLAYRRARQGLDAVTAGDVWIWAAEVVTPAMETAVASGRPDDAADLARAFARGVTGRNAPVARAAVDANRGVLREATGDHAEAAVAWRQAAERFRRLGRPYDAARAETACGRNLLASGHAAGGMVMRAAESHLQGLGAWGDADEVRRLLARGAGSGGDGTRPARRGRRAYGSRLSPREGEVAALAGKGLTNAEIAIRLNISSRTVEDHVAAAVRKLELPSKRALRAHAASGFGELIP